jgi:AraC-like DNA-binding protein
MNTRRPRVIFLTGVDSSTAAVAAVKLGAEDWIVKPFDETLLLTQLRGLFHNRRIFIHGGDSGTRGTIAVLASRSCGLSVEYLEDGLAPSDDGGSPVIDAVIAGSEKGLAALLSRPPLMTALGESTIAALHHVSRRYWEVNVDGLAQAVGLSADSLLKLFKRDLSVTPREYIARVRVEVIKQRLARPGRPSLERLAEEVGLCDAAHLSRIFMRYEGQSPGLYGNIQGDGGSIH